MRTFARTDIGSLVADSVALFGGSVDGHVYSVSKQTGQVLWSNQYAEEFSGQPQVLGNRVYFGSNAGTMRSLDARQASCSGNTRRAVPFREPLQSKTIWLFRIGRWKRLRL
jgi:outer membrane protein assembly factor BamB